MHQPVLKALHNAARIYCEENHMKWATFYNDHHSLSTGRIYGTNLRAEQIFPRYLVLTGISIAVEHYVPEDFEDLADAKRKLIEAAQAAHYHTTPDLTSDDALEAMSEERLKFSQYIESLQPENLKGIPTLPYRRTLKDPEAAELLKKVEEKWPSLNWYFPDPPFPFESQVFQDAWFYAEVPFDIFQSILNSHGIKRTLYLRYNEICFELDTPHFERFEGYQTSSEMDWLLSSSGDGDITICGDWLLSEIKAVWPAWEKRIYKGWDYPHPGDVH